MNHEAHLGHGSLALETAPDPVVNTLGLPPCLLHTVVAVRLVAPAMKSECEFTGNRLLETDLNLLVRFLTILMAMAS